MTNFASGVVRGRDQGRVVIAFARLAYGGLRLELASVEAALKSL